MAKKSTASKKSAPKARKLVVPGIVYRLKITLAKTNPPVWRRVEVPGDVTLADLHYIIQGVMGWQDCHLHQFNLGETCYSMRVDYFDDDGATHEESEYQLQDLLKPRQKFSYEYDFGDRWIHEIVVEAKNPPEPGATYPVCIGGERACPPEDCGGVYGYRHLLEVRQDPKHPDYKELMQWLGRKFDPDQFDVKKANQELAQIFS